MSIGNRFKDLRIKAGYNKKQVSELLDMPYTTYNNYETDAREPGSDTLRKVAKLYGVTVDYLLEYERSDLFISGLSSSEIRILNKIRKLDLSDRLRIEERIDTFLESNKYDLKEEEQTG